MENCESFIESIIKLEFWHVNRSHLTRIDSLICRTISVWRLVFRFPWICWINMNKATVFCLAASREIYIQIRICLWQSDINNYLCFYLITIDWNRSCIYWNLCFIFKCGIPEHLHITCARSAQWWSVAFLFSRFSMYVSLFDCTHTAWNYPFQRNNVLNYSTSECLHFWSKNITNLHCDRLDQWMNHNFGE